MLTIKQKVKLDRMVRNYFYGIRRTHKCTFEQAEMYTERYRAIMELVLQNQNRRLERS